MAGEKYIALEETSQAIKEAVDGVKTDVAGVKTDVGGVKTDVGGVQVDVDTVGTDLTTVKNNIGTPAGGKTVVTMIDEIINSSGEDEYLFVASDTDILLSETLNITASSDITALLKKQGKVINIIPYCNGEVTFRFTLNTSDLSLSGDVGLINLETGKYIVSQETGTGQATKVLSMRCQLEKNKAIAIGYDSHYDTRDLVFKKMEILATLQKVDKAKNIAIGYFTNTKLPDTAAK